MILRRHWLSKNDLAKRRGRAEELLDRLAKAGGLPKPNYEYEPGGKKKKKRYFYLLRYQVPDFIRQNAEFKTFHAKVLGTGRDKLKSYARSLAALEVVTRIEEGLNVRKGTLDERLAAFKKQKKERNSTDAPPVRTGTRFVTWLDVPKDTTAPKEPGSRRGLLEFFSGVIHNPKALAAAKFLTLSAQERLPELHVHAEKTESGELQQWAEIRSFGKVEGVMGPKDEQSMSGAVILALEKAYDAMKEKNTVQSYEDPNSSFGMAKLFVKLPEDQFKKLNELLSQVNRRPVRPEQTVEQKISRANYDDQRPLQNQVDGEDLQSRLTIFRAHQEKSPLSIDSVEENVLREAAVTIVRGFSGSGKTTRFPSMISLLSPNGPSTRVIVSQPHSLTCQTAARRAAFEQDIEFGSKDCPIGYATEKESFLATSESRTVVYETPGLLLQRAVNDPLFGDVTHLCIDEAHERSAKTDLVLALAKRALRKRSNHATLPPLRVVLMTDSSDEMDWESYFSDAVDCKDDVAIVDVPKAERFTTDFIHLSDATFPNHIVAMRRLRKQHGRDVNEVGDYDEALCEATAKLVVEVLKEGSLDEGSILCFLPSIHEILSVTKKLRGKIKKQQSKGSFSQDDTPEIIHLHSSTEATLQPVLFEAGSKIILSTDTAVTSLTIPGVKVLIDSGRMRQSPPIGSSVSPTAIIPQLANVNISKAAAKLRGRAVSHASDCTWYRLYRKQVYDKMFPKSTTPEMLRVDLSQLVLNMLSLYDGGLPFSLLLDTPDPPTAARLRKTIRELANQGHIEYDPKDEEIVRLSPLGQVTSLIPTTPRLAKLLLAGISLRAVDSALRIAALLSIPTIFLRPKKPLKYDSMKLLSNHSSDIAKMLEAYRTYEEKHSQSKLNDVFNIEFQQVHLVHQQLEQALKSSFQRNGVEIDENDWRRWNFNSDRVAALVGLICRATPHVAHLVSGSNDFATRDVAGTAIIDEHSANALPEMRGKRVHCYAYNELLTAAPSDGSSDLAPDAAPTLHVTTAVSPLELALFAEDTSAFLADGGIALPESEDFLLLADQWAPIAVSEAKQRESLLKLRRLLTKDFLQHVAQDPNGVVKDPVYRNIVAFALSAIEQQRS